MFSIALDDSGNIRENVYTAVKIEDKFYKYFKNQKDIEVELPEFNPPEMEETETGEITFTKQEFKYVQLFMNYYWGKPKQITEVNVQEDIPMFQIEVVK